MKDSDMQAKHSGKTGVRVYLDYAASTPLDERVKEVMEPYWSDQFGNPGSLHAEGVAADKALEEARKTCAKSIGAHADGVIFTSGGTEANSLALRGAMEKLLEEHTPASLHMVTSTIEHASVRCVFEYFEKKGVAVTYVSVNEEGEIDTKVLKESLQDNTVLVSIMYANNEFGTIQPVADIGRAILAHKKERSSAVPLYFHIDASQAALYLDCDVKKLHADFMTLDGQKLYGPKGVGVLFASRQTTLQPLFCGSGYEHGVRAGTPNIPLIVGMAESLKNAVAEREILTERMTTLRDACIALLEKEIEGVVLNGSRTRRLANNINISVPGKDAEYLVLSLDARGIACATQSACHERDEHKRKAVVRALGKGEEIVQGAIRISLGKETAEADLETFVETLKAVLQD